MFEIMSGTIPVLIHIPHDSIAIPNELIDEVVSRASSVF